MDDFPAETVQLQTAVPPGTEAVVAELVEITTQRLADAYIRGFKEGSHQTLRIVAESGTLDSRVQKQVQDFVKQYDDQEDTP